MKGLIFFFFSSLTVLFAALSVASKNVVRGGISLLLALAFLGAVYFTAGAPNL